MNREAAQTDSRAHLAGDAERLRPTLQHLSGDLANSGLVVRNHDSCPCHGPPPPRESGTHPAGPLTIRSP